MRIVVGLLVAGTFLAGCAQQPKVVWVRADGQRASVNPVLATQFELDSTACLGERNKAALSGVTVASGGFAAIAAAAERGAAADTVARGCMAEKGYLLVPEDQAEAKSAELAAVAAERKRQEEAARVSAPSQAKRSSKPAT
jgi:uncharacterized lipoprotein YajG